MREYSTKEAAIYLGVSQRTVQIFFNRGHFPSAHKLDPTRKNSPLRIPEDDLQYFKMLRTQPQP